MTRIITSLFFTLMTFASMAQTEQAPAMAEGFRADGKIWVVIAVIALVFLALVGWLVMLEKRIGKMERTMNLK